LTLWLANRAWISAERPTRGPWVFHFVPRYRLAQAAAQVADLVGPPDDHYYEDVRSRYSQIRGFLPVLLEEVEFTATGAGRPVIEAIHFLK
jgi:hypothetical protein